MRRREFITLLGGVAAAWPHAARAQQPAMPVIGFLSGSSPQERVAMMGGFRRGLGEAGYSEGQNVAIEFRGAQGQYDRLPALAAELVRREVAVMVAGDAPSVVVAKAATATIPIVFNMAADPIRLGIVSSLNRPGGNITGITLLAGPMPAKQFGLLHDLLPAAKTMAMLVNPNNRNAERDAATVEEAARAVGVRVLVTRAVAEADFDKVFATLAQEQAGALLVNSDIFFTSQRDRLIALTARHAIPAIFTWREFPAAGALMSYGPSLVDAYRQMGIYTGRILKGAKPADLPIVQPTKFEFIINLNTAKALGVTFSPGLLAIADEVIE